MLDSPVQAVSGGELQRVMLARALLRSLICWWTNRFGVDLNGQYELYDLIGGLRRTHGCGMLMVSHELHLVMATTDHVLCLNRHVCCSGHPDHVAAIPPTWICSASTVTAAGGLPSPSQPPSRSARRRGARSASSFRVGREGSHRPFVEQDRG